MKPPNPTPRRKTFIYSGISLKVSRCLLLCVPDEVAHNNGGGELGQRLRFRFAMEIVSGGLAGEFAQQDKFCTGRAAEHFCYNIRVILPLLGGIYDPRCPQRLA